MKKNLVSVILFIIKKKNILKTIKSLLKQTYKNYELICIYDDNNLDDLKFLKKTISKINKVKLIINKNLGVAKSRNLAINIQKENLLLLDADDLWKKNKLNDQINIKKKNKLDLTCTSYSIIDEYDNIKSVRKVGNEITMIKYQKDVILV